MNRSQRRVVAVATYVLAAILFVAYFGKPAWAWATWNEKQNTLDLGFVKITNRPAFPGDARGIGLGLVLPVVLAAAGALVGLGGRDEADEE
jgi:hypothetical protein